jgi:hypothetical protein
MDPDKIAAQGLDPPIPAIFFADAVPALGQTHLAISKQSSGTYRVLQEPGQIPVNLLTCYVNPSFIHRRYDS